MLERIWVSFFATGRQRSGAVSRNPRLRRCRFRPEPLEDRKLMTAALAAINNISVPAQMGYQVLLDGSGASGTPRQTFTATSSNPDIGAAVARGPFFALDVTHTAFSPSDISFTGTMVTQLFQDLTPKTVDMIRQFVSDGYYVGKDFTRIANGFPGVTDFVAQGGAPNSNGTGESGQPGTPFADEIVQQLAFNNSNLMAMANKGIPVTNDTQFFLTTSTPTSLDYKHTVFGRLVSGQSILNDMTMVTLNNNPITGEKSFPASPITITAASISEANVNGVLHIDTTQAKVGETSTITVTATDPTTNTQVTRTFNVTVGAYNGPNPAPINFRPFATPVTQDVNFGASGTVHLIGQSGNLTAASTETITYRLTSQPSHGKITNFDPQAGTFTYTPNAGFLGVDGLEYQVVSTNSAKGPVAVSNPTPVTINVVPGVTGAVRQVNNVLIVTPPPHRRRKFTNTILVSQTAGANPVLQVTVNGVVDALQPAASRISQLVVYGSKANDRITIDPSVSVTTTLDGGRGGRNRLAAGSSNTREHGWFGHNALVGGTGRNQLVGLAGQVRFKPTRKTSMIFAGVPHQRKHDNRPNPPGGTFYRFVNGRLVVASSKP